MKNYTDINVVLDKSGSMGMLRDDTIGGFNTFLKDQQDADGNAKITLIQFSTDYNFTHNAVDIQKAEPLNQQTYAPGGGTALLDAVGRCINETGQRLKELSEDKRPKQVIFMIITDGEENSSREFKREQIKKMIEHQQKKYDWEFIFLGANQDAFNEAAQMGIVANVANWEGTSKGTAAAYSAVSSGLKSYRSAGVRRSAGILKGRVDDQGNITPSSNS